MGQITVPDHLVDGSAEDAAFEDARQRALDKFTFDRPEEVEEDRLDPARGIIFGTLGGLVVIVWAGFALWRYLP